MNTQKTLKIIFSLIGLLIIITSGIFIFQTLKDLDNLKFSQVKNFLNKEEEKQILEDTDIDTTNWKTYRNEEFGFEFKYPEEWEVEIKTRKELDNDDILFNLYLISKENKGRSLIIRDIKDGIIFLNRMEISEPGEKKNIIINNIQWTSFDFTGGNVEGFYMDTSLSLATAHKDKTFILFTPDKTDLYFIEVARTLQFLD